MLINVQEAVFESDPIDSDPIDSHENIKMRLPIKYQQTIKKYFNTFFDGEIYLFGSRVDDAKKGDNIDLYLVVNNQDNLFQKKIDLC